MMKRKREDDRDNVPFTLAPELTSYVSVTKMKDAIAEVAGLVAKFTPITSASGTGMLDRIYSIPRQKGISIYFVFRPFVLDIGRLSAIEAHSYVSSILLMTTATDMTLSISFADIDAPRCPFAALTETSDLVETAALPSLIDAGARKKALRLVNVCANLPLLTGWHDFADALTTVRKTSDSLIFTFVHGSFSLEPLIDVQRASCVDGITVEVVDGKMQLTVVFNDGEDVAAKKRKE